MNREKTGKRIVACAVLLLAAAIIIVSGWGPAIFQRGNPIPYLVAAAKISDEQPYVRVMVDTDSAIFISKRGGCPELFDDIENDWDRKLLEQAGSSYIFSNGISSFVVGSEIYWSAYIVWTVPQSTLQG